MSTTIDASVAVIRDDLGNILLDTSDAQYDVILTNVDDNPPEVRKSIVAIPGRNGDLDLSDALTGYPVYTSRTLALTFVIGEGLKDASTHPNRTDSYEIYHDLMGEIHGKMCHVEYTEQKNTYGTYAYMRGRANFSAPSYIEGALEFSVEFDCDPWIYTGTQTQGVTMTGSAVNTSGYYGTKLGLENNKYNLSRHQVSFNFMPTTTSDYSYQANTSKIKLQIAENGANIFDINSMTVDPFGIIANTSYEIADDALVITCTDTSTRQLGCYLFESNEKSSAHTNGSAWHVPNMESSYADTVKVFAEVESLNGGTLPTVYLTTYKMTPDGTQSTMDTLLCDANTSSSSASILPTSGCSDFYMSIAISHMGAPFKLKLQIQQTPRDISTSALSTWYAPKINTYIIDLPKPFEYAGGFVTGDRLYVSPARVRFAKYNIAGSKTEEHVLQGVAFEDADKSKYAYAPYARAYVESNGTVNHRWTIIPQASDMLYPLCDDVTINAGVMPTVVRLETHSPVKLKRDGVTAYVNGDAAVPFDFKPGNNTFEVLVYDTTAALTQFVWEQGVI